TIGVALLARARFAAWFWIGFNVGVLGALALVIWLMSESIFVLGTLCPWCLVTWAVVIPLFWIVTIDNLRTGRIRTTA
ncbi:vitamin K epoxide reductase family protein, partial [Rhizobium johnstonii]|uniref:vitamin K epoxide reductase family protein n=1 Tax=Rhizobium johnstonii TaxID=3019933 RepID=UPI003F9B0CD2